jgi:hypothetical protein
VSFCLGLSWFSVAACRYFLEMIGGAVQDFVERGFDCQAQIQVAGAPRATR